MVQTVLTAFSGNCDKHNACSAVAVEPFMLRWRLPYGEVGNQRLKLKIGLQCAL
jgi:hypothetical protein